MRHAILITLTAAALVLSGCAGQKSRRGGASDAPTTTTDTTGASTAPAGAGASSAGAGEVVRVTPPANDGFAAGPSGELLSKRVVYFDFDKDELRASDQAIVAAHARYLVSNPAVRIRLEGHTDERGTREYNIGLGERRAQSIRRALMLQGVGEGQLATVSFGEERPAADGDDESAWSQNRRVEILYLP